MLKVNRVGAGLQAAKLPVEVSGIPPLAHIAFKVPNAQAARTLYTQTLLDRGFLASGAFYAMFAHTDTQVDRFIAACGEAFEIVAAALRDDTLTAQLRGPVAHAGFQRLT